MNPPVNTTEARIVERLLEFKLTIAAEELVPRLVADGHTAALTTVLEVLDAEAEERHQRRVTRLRRASKAPTRQDLRQL